MNDLVKTLASLLDDLERARIANGNRVGAYERRHGEALPELLHIQEQMERVEHLAELALVRAWRKYPLAAWAKTYHGLGEKSIARLVALIGVPHLGTTGHWEGQNGDRAWVIDDTYERTVSQLWSYCGHGDAKRRRTKDMTQEEAMKLGKPEAKKQVWLISTSLLKAGVRKDESGSSYAISPLGAIYLAQREKYKDAVHAEPCKRCGPSGKPALPGSPLSDGHKHARALRALGKEFLKDLYDASRAIAHAEPSEGSPDHNSSRAIAQT